MPSSQVCSNVESPLLPHLLNQAPPLAQQLRLPDFLIVAHLWHTAVFFASLEGIEANVGAAMGGVAARYCWRVGSEQDVISQS